MTNLIKLIQNENMKIFRKVSTWIMIGLLVVAAIGAAVITNITNNNMDSGDMTWQQRLEQDNTYYKTDINNEDYPEVTKEYFKKQLALNEYRLEHNIPPIESDSIWSFMDTASAIVSVITLFTIIVGASSVASEFSWGTIKLLLIRPVSRTKILLSKYLSTIIFALVSLIILFVVSLLVGSIIFGFDGSQPHLVYRDGEVHEVNMILYVLGVFGLKSINLVMMSTFAFMVSTVFRSSSLAIGLAIFLMFAGVNVTTLLALKFDWAKYILFANTDLSLYLSGNPFVEGMTMGFSIIMLIIYFVVFNAISWIVFNKRDVAA